MARKARHRRKLTDLGSDLLAAILCKLPDTRSRVAAAAASAALWRASCLPGAWKDASLALDLNKPQRTSSALSFLTRQGKGLLRVELSLKPGTCSLPRTQQRLAPLLAQLPVLQELELRSQHLAVLSDVAASLPQLQQLTIGPADPQTTLLLPDDLASLQGLSCLQRLVVSLDPEHLSSGLEPLLRGVETLASLTGLLLKYVDASGYGVPCAPCGKWSTQLTRLQRLQLYQDELGLELPLELASLPELRSVFVGCFDWEDNGNVLCALRGLTSLTVLYDDEGASSAVPDPAGFKQALGSLQELRWELPASRLYESGRFDLQGLTSLTMHGHLDLYACLLWSPVCRLQRLVLEEMLYEEGTLDLAALSPLTSLTFLSVGGIEGLDFEDECQAVILPRTPCLATLQVLTISCAGMTCVPADLRQAGRLRVLNMRDPELYISRACVATLTALAELVHLKVEVVRSWTDKHNQRKGWDWESVRNLRLLHQARPDVCVVRLQDGSSADGGD